MTENNKYQVVIVGAGPAGLTAGIYTARAGLSTLVIGSLFESQVAKLGLIENYPGFAKGIQGLELMEEMGKQTKASGAKILEDRVVSIEKVNKGFSLKTEEEENIKTKAIILAMGGRYRKMRIPGEEKLFQKGVSYCAVCDGALYRNKVTTVLGYGNGAAKAVLYLANLSPKVYLLCPKKELGAEAIYEYRLKGKENIVMHYNARVSKILGEEFVTKVLFKKEGQENEIETEGVFIEFGTVPNTVLAKQINVKVDEKGYLVVNKETQETNIPGVFAAGDVSGGIRQIATAIGEGCIAAAQVQNYLG